MSQVGDDDDSPPHALGRFSVPHRDGARVEVGTPIHIGGDRPWLCAVKLVGPGRDSSPRDLEDPSEQTHTLLVRTGRGSTPEEAQREAMAQLTLVYGSPVEPPPAPLITQMRTDPPPPPLAAPPAPPPRGLWARIRSLWK